MDFEDARAMLKKAVESDPAYPAITGLVWKLRDKGMKQVEMYALYTEFQLILDPESMEYDAVVETLDAICGTPYMKEYALFQHELTQEEINSYYNR